MDWVVSNWKYISAVIVFNFVLGYMSGRKPQWKGRAMAPEMIAVPLRTALKIIVRHQNAWMVWTGIDDMQQPYTEWRGAYIMLRDNGTAYSVIVQPDGSETQMRIK